tara:strand:+ start:39918 stop:40031 length:114 start_codon:yes stop_codon:yes gene_type:complete
VSAKITQESYLAALPKERKAAFSKLLQTIANNFLEGF